MPNITAAEYQELKVGAHLLCRPPTWERLYKEIAQGGRRSAKIDDEPLPVTLKALIAVRSL